MAERQKRSRIEIMYEMIYFLSHTKYRNMTVTMRKLNLSRISLLSYLEEIQNKGLLIRTGNNQFNITPKGYEFIKIYKNIKNILGENSGLFI